MRGAPPWLALTFAFVASVALGWLLGTGGRLGRPGPVQRHRPRTQTAWSADLREALATPQSAPVAARTLAPAAPAASQTPEGSPATGGGTGDLAVIIDDCGQWPTIERALIALPIPLTVSIMPEAPYAQTIEQTAHSAGQGIMLHLPMEPSSSRPAGGGEITTAMDNASIEAQVRADLDRVPLASGVNNHEGSKATADPRVMRAVAGALASEGRFFVDSRTTAHTVAAEEAAQVGVPTASRNVFLDDVVTQAAVEAQLERAGAIARERGHAIAIGHPKEAVLAALEFEIPILQRSGVRFVLAQDLVR